MPLKNLVSGQLLFVCVLLLNEVVTVTGQSRSFGTLPILRPDNISGDRITTDLNHTEDFRHIEAIYKKLVNARGDFRYPVPALFLREEEGYVASMDYNELSVIIEKKAYDVCKKLGDPAIAFLLAHELTHYYEKHAWRSDFVFDLQGLEVAQNLKGLQDQVLNESQADYLGGFLAYSAGYGLFDKGGVVIDSLYKAYKRPEKLDNYPSKADRISMANKSAEKIRQLADIFDLANNLTITGNYGAAFDCYRHLLIQYQSCEIYNNTGSAAVLEALTQFNKDSLKYRYVTQLDIVFDGARSSASNKESLLRQAIQYFDAAVSLDPDYAPGYLNKANAYALLNEDAKARFYIENEAMPAMVRSKGKYPKTESDILVLRGILEAKAGNKIKATDFFNAAIQLKNPAATFNKNVVEGIPNPVSGGLSASHFLNDSIGAMTLNKYFRAPSHILSKQIEINKKKFIRQSGGKKDFRILLFTNENGTLKSSFVFLQAMEGYTGKTVQNIGKGSTMDQVLAAYGQPGDMISAVQGNILLYNGSIRQNDTALGQNKLLIITDDKNVVTKWMYYGITSN